MKIAYHFTIPPPTRPELDAVVQEAMTLARRFPGELNYLYPGTRVRMLFPRLLCGWHQMKALARIDAHVDVHQIYSNGLVPYPIIKRFTKPVVYKVVTRVGHGDRLGFLPFWKRIHTFVVSSPEDRIALRSRGFARVETSYPGVRLERFCATPPPPAAGFVLLAGSAPWSESQFRTKGVDRLLEVARSVVDLRVVFLWRDVLYERMKARVRAAGVGDRVEVVNRRVDVARVLGGVHASVVLADRADLVKCYPHSLVESLAAGRPVLVSGKLAMADYVRRTSCGEVVSGPTLDELVGAVERLRRGYQTYRLKATTLDLEPFSQDSLLNRYHRIYDSITGPADRQR